MKGDNFLFYSSFSSAHKTGTDILLEVLGDPFKFSWQPLPVPHWEGDPDPLDLAVLGKGIKCALLSPFWLSLWD